MGGIATNLLLIGLCLMLMYKLTDCKQITVLVYALGQCFIPKSHTAFFDEKLTYVSVFLECAKRKYLEFTTKENMRGKRAKDETLRKAFSRTLVFIWSLVILS